MKSKVTYLKDEHVSAARKEGIIDVVAMGIAFSLMLVLILLFCGVIDATVII